MKTKKWSLSMKTKKWSLSMNRKRRQQRLSRAKPLLIIKRSCTVFAECHFWH